MNSKNNCHKTTNNKYFQCPPRMSDGRHFTDYRPSCDSNNSVRNGNNITNSYDYRMFLNRNAENIMKKSHEYYFMKNGSFDCQKPYEVGTMLPERTRVVCNNHRCEAKLINENGFGEGREYVTNPPNAIRIRFKF